MTEQEYKLPYRIHLIPITGPSIESNSWACGECRRVQLSFEEAKRCCDPRLCEKCGEVLGRRSDGGWLVCQECRSKIDAENRQTVWDKMPEVEYVGLRCVPNDSNLPRAMRPRHRISHR